MAERHFEEEVKLNTSKGDFILQERVEYNERACSFFYVLDDMAIIIDKDVWLGEQYPYSMLTNKQNEYMHAYKRVYRFIEEDIGQIEDYLDEKVIELEDVKYKKAAGRENMADASPLELYFEDRFSEVYGRESIRFLQKEFAILDQEGATKYFDYFLSTDDGNIAVEENGVSYHHPQVIGKDDYKKQLNKQNICVALGIKIFRFSSEDCGFTSRINDDIKSYFGDDASRFKESGLLVDRPLGLYEDLDKSHDDNKGDLYEHQEELLSEIDKSRKAGITGYLVVLPTGTGKSRVVEEDMLRYAKEHGDFKALILVPGSVIQEDWEKRISTSLSALKDKITLTTYSYMGIHCYERDPEYFDYIVVDEAHHAVAPGIKRTIQYFHPKFLMGLTATDQRPDKMKLETVFGSYRSHLSLEDAMAKGIIASCNAFRIETDINLSKVRINGKDYVNADLENSIRVTSRNELIGQVLKKYFCEGEVGQRQGVVFCVNVDHAREMETVLNNMGISAKAYVSGSDTDNIMEAFREKKIRFLCSCQMISEGWDYPELGILVMARPTLSKVLYLQQLGRGLRKTEKKKNLFVIDVVDEYGSMVKPFTINSIFHNPYYVPFGDPRVVYKPGDIIVVDGLVERVVSIIPVDIDSFGDKYGNYLSQEQLAQDYFVSTGTITSWIRSGKIEPTIVFEFGSKKIPMFSPEDRDKYRDEMDIPIHNDVTIKEDFLRFLDERDFALSYKMTFLLGFLKYMDQNGEANIDKVLDYYINFYQDRIDKGLPVDRRTCPYNSETLKDRTFIKKSMLTNPFEKYGRKRFMYYSKDLGNIAMNHALFRQLDEEDIDRAKQQTEEDLANYYAKLEKKLKTKESDE